MEISDVIAIHEEIIRTSGGAQGILFEGILESCMERHETDIFGYQPFQDAFEKAAALMQCIIVFHPFLDGNKRTGIVIAKMFLEINGFSLDASTNECVEFTIKIAQEQVAITEIVEWLRNHSSPTPYL